MKVIGSGKDYEAIEVLILEKKDFELSKDEIYNLKDHKGHRFAICFIPRKFKNVYSSRILFKVLKGTLYIGARLKAKILFYDEE